MVDLAPFGLSEVVGTDASDQFIGERRTVFFGLGGADRFTSDQAIPGRLPQFFAGGSGDDTYVVRFDTAVGILESGGSANDTIRATWLSATGPDAVIYEIEGRHLVVGHAGLEGGFAVLNWLDPASRVENVELADGTFRFGIDFTSAIVRALPGYQGNFSIAEAAALGLATKQGRELLAANGDEAIIARAFELENAAPTSGTPQDDVLTGTPGSDTLAGYGGDDQISGLGGSDVLRGGSGDDLLLGGNGADDLGGGTGNDQLNGGGGTDHMAGGDGHDTFVVDNPGDLVVEGANAGSDRVESSVAFTLPAHVEDLILTGNAQIGTGNLLANLITGNGEDNQLSGGGGHDTLDGRRGADVLSGGSGDDSLTGGRSGDVLLGGQGDDELLGNRGQDRLDGKSGEDTLTGGLGADQFAFSVIDGALDQISDFDPAQGDTLDLSEPLPGFQAGDVVTDFVELTTDPAGTTVAVDPSGSGAAFTDVVLFHGTSIDSLSPGQLGLPEAPAS